MTDSRKQAAQLHFGNMPAHRATPTERVGARLLAYTDELEAERKEMLSMLAEVFYANNQEESGVAIEKVRQFLHSRKDEVAVLAKAEGGKDD